MIRARVAVLAAVVGVVTVAYAVHSQVPNRAPASFGDVLRSSTGRPVRVIAGGDVTDGSLAAVNADYLTVTTADKIELQIPFASVSHTLRQGNNRDVSIVLR